MARGTTFGCQDQSRGTSFLVGDQNFRYSGGGKMVWTTTVRYLVLVPTRIWTNINAKQKHPRCKKVRDQSEAAGRCNQKSAEAKKLLYQ